MAISKVTYAGNTLIDLTGDTVTPENLLSGATAHAANGEKITGIVEDKKGELEAQIADLRSQIGSLKSDLITVQDSFNWQSKGHFSGTNTLDITDILDSKEIFIIARLTPPGAYATKVSMVARGSDFRDEGVDIMLSSGGYFGETYGIGVLIKYTSSNKTLSINDGYYNARLDKSNIDIYVYYR